MDFKQQLIGFEGREHHAYPDPLTGGEPWTIGVGHTGPEVHEGLVWTDAQIDAAFEADCLEVEEQCLENFDWFAQLDEPRQAVVMGMCFQMGLPRLLKFRNTLSDMREGRYAAAADGMLNSLWARQTPRRVEVLAHQMKSGEFA